MAFNMGKHFLETDKPSVPYRYLDCGEDFDDELPNLFLNRRVRCPKCKSTNCVSQAKFM